MIEFSEGVPAHIAMLVNEKFPFTDWKKARKRIREMSRDLKDQVSLASPFNPEEIASDSARPFKVTMGGGLDLFGRDGACKELRCKISNAEEFARSIVLVADQVAVHDFVGDKIQNLGRLSNNAVDSLLVDVVLLKLLSPLIEARLLVFNSPWFAVCGHCQQYSQERLEALTEELFQTHRANMKLVRRHDGSGYAFVPSLYSPDLFYHFSTQSRDRPDDEILYNLIRVSVSATLHNARFAAATGGTLFSNSPIGLSALMREERVSIDAPTPGQLHNIRAGRLPWVRGLSIEQTIQLRQEASSALPRFRALLARHLAARPISDEEVVTTEAEFVAELQEQAEEVRSELKIATRKSKSIFNNFIGVSGLGIASLSLATSLLSPIEGVLALLQALGTVRQLASPHEDHATALRSKPGYVLVAAEEILAHAKT